MTIEVALADTAVRERVRGEYQEMPGLRLTIAQASRLFGLDLARCTLVLDALVEEGALWTNGREFLAAKRRASVALRPSVS